MECLESRLAPVGNTTTSYTLSDATNPISAPPITAVFGELPTVTATVTAQSGGGTPTGTVTFALDGSAFASNIPLDGSGQATGSISVPPSVGNHTISATYTPSSGSGWNASTGNNGGATALVVNQAATNTAITSAPTVTYGAHGMVTVTVSNTSAGSTAVPVGLVTLTVDSTNFTHTLAAGDSGVWTFDVGVQGAGEHTLSASFAGSTDFVASGPATRTLHVNQATLTVTADDQTRAMGSSNPAFTAHFSGFVNGDGLGSLGGTLTFATPAVATSPAGTYAITPAGLTSANYAITYVNGTLTITAILPPPPPPPPAPTLNLPPFVDVAFTPDGSQQVTELVDRNGNLTQFDSSGSHKLATGIRSASVVFRSSGEIMVLVNSVGQLIQVDSKGAHLLASGVLSADVSLSGGQEVLEVVFLGGLLFQFDSSGAHLLGTGVQIASVAFGATGEVMAVVYQTGVLFQFDATGSHQIATGVIAAGVGFAPSANDLTFGTLPSIEALDVVFSNGSVFQFNAFSKGQFVGTV
jgi:hypothetical protein